MSWFCLFELILVVLTILASIIAAVLVLAFGMCLVHDVTERTPDFLYTRDFLLTLKALEEAVRRPDAWARGETPRIRARAYYDVPACGTIETDEQYIARLRDHIDDRW